MSYQQCTYKNKIILFVIALALTSCTTPRASLPSFAGKPRIKINQNISVFDKPTPAVIIDADQVNLSAKAEGSL